MIGLGRVASAAVPLSLTLADRSEATAFVQRLMHSARALQRELHRFGFDAEHVVAMSDQGLELATGAARSKTSIQAVHRAKALCSGILAAAIDDSSHTLLEPLVAHLEHSRSVVGSEHSLSIKEQLATFEVHGSTQRVIEGPKVAQLDPAFVLCDQPGALRLPTFGASAEETLRFLWTLASREAMASDLAALNVAEFDGMPTSYYFDFSRQAWDESRHARFYLSQVKPTWITYRDRVDSSTLEFRAVREFLARGTGLPIPYEGTCYTSVWSATLPERLVLMNIRTEGPSVAAKKGRLTADLHRNLPDLATGIEIDMRDEATHARFGTKWLRHLYPDEIERRAAIESADLLRGFLMALSLAERAGTRAATALDAVLAG